MWFTFYLRIQGHWPPVLYHNDAHGCEVKSELIVNLLEHPHQPNKILHLALRCLGWIEFWSIKSNKMTILGEAYILIVSSLKIEDLVLEYIRYGMVYFGPAMVASQNYWFIFFYLRQGAKHNFYAMKFFCNIFYKLPRHWSCWCLMDSVDLRISCFIACQHGIWSAEISRNMW